MYLNFIYFFFFVIKGKKKVGEGDILLEMEVQRQRERLKLMELERKKRELNAGSRLTNEKDNAGGGPTGIHNKHSQKRVNIVTPTVENHQQQQP